MSVEIDRISEALPDYTVLRELGRGGMGVVYLGKHRRLERGVAIKELPAAFASEPEVRDRFGTEARTLASLAHPHIVPIYDYVEREDLCLIVMEELPGGTVWDRFTTAGLTPPTACAVVMACCAALQHAHDKGVLHLDVKPDNLMFDDTQAVKVTDFGISRVLSGGQTLGTVDGQVLGTPAYMSPEQARGRDLTPASDVYAAGVMLYELLSGRLPWEGATSASELLAQRLKEEPDSLREVAPHVPQPLAEVVMKAIEREPDNRYSRAEDFGVAIGEAAAESWGPEWIDVAGVAIVGSERLSLAARTTGRRAATGSTGTHAPASDARTTGSAGRRDETVVASSGDSDTRSGETMITGPSGEAERVAGETTVTGSSDAGARVEGAGETSIAGPAAGGERVAGETSVAGPVGEAAPETEPEGAAASGEARSAAAPAAQSAAAPAPGQLPQFQVVRAAGAEQRIEGADLNRLERADLIGVEDVLDPPKPPWASMVVAALLLAAAVVVAVTGLGEPSPEVTLDEGQVRVAGVDVASDETIDLDLSGDVVVNVDDPELAAQTDEVKLEMSLFGIPLGSASADLESDGTATVDPGLMQRMGAGGVTGTVELSGDDETIASSEFSANATQAWFLTALGIGGILLVLLSIANLESSLKPLRRGRYRNLSFLGAAISGLILGVGLAVLAGVALGVELTIATMVVCAVLCATAGLSLVVVAVGRARRKRVRGAVKRAEKRIGVRVTGRAA